MSEVISTKIRQMHGTGHHCHGSSVTAAPPEIPLVVLVGNYESQRSQFNPVRCHLNLAYVCIFLTSSLLLVPCHSVIPYCVSTLS